MDTTSLRISLSELPDVIPSNSVVDVEQIDRHDLHFGDVVCLPGGSRLVMGHFLAHEPEGVLRLSKGKGRPHLETWRKRTVLRVLRVHAQGRTYNPRGNPLSQLWNWFTRYGTR